MASRRASVVSTRSVRQRKYSTDRHQRQAELSIRIEEGRPLRLASPPLVPEEDASTSLAGDYFSMKPEGNAASTLSHADAGLSPIHPGHRIRGFSEVFNDLARKESSAFKNPFPEPNAEQQQDIEQRSAVFKRVNTEINATEAHRRITRSASDARTRATGPIDRLKKLLGRKSTIKPGAYSGLEYAAGLATAHANAILSQKAAPQYKRRALYVFEYSIGDDGVLFCAPPKICDTVSSLRQYLEGDQQLMSLLRLIYACNNEEAVNYLSNAFGISSASKDTGERSFRDWMQDERDTRRASHKAIRWRPSFDIARGVTCSAFGLDFGSLIVPRDMIPGPVSLAESRVHRRLQTQESRASNASLYRQRVAVYMQRASAQALPSPRITRFNSGLRPLHDMAKRDTIIICEYSSGSVGEIVSASALLGLSPEPALTATDAFDEEDNEDDDQDNIDPSSTRSSPSGSTERLRLLASAAAVQSVVTHVFEGLSQLWHAQMAAIHEPHAELEDHVYAHPSDTTRARDVWVLSQRLHHMLKLVHRHAKVAEAVQEDLHFFSERQTEGRVGSWQQDWLGSLLDEFETLSESIRTDYLEPLEHMIDLMYKSVSIKDSKQSLELNASLWRLSWITFIFLPLTFLAGMFGMNVDALKDFPSLKWYFVAAVPLMLGVYFLWFTMRRFAPGQRSIIDAASLSGKLMSRPRPGGDRFGFYPMP